MKYFPPSSPCLLFHLEALWKRLSYNEEGSPAICFREAVPENAKREDSKSPTSKAEQRAEEDTTPVAEHKDALAPADQFCLKEAMLC